MQTNIVSELENKSYLTIADLLEVDSTAFKMLADTLSTLNARQLLYHYKTGLANKPVCPVCSNDLAWNSDARAYRRFCSKKCTGIGTSVQASNTHLKKYGQHYSSTTEFKDKVQQTSLTRFGVEHYSKTSEFSERTKATNLDKFGVEFPAQSLSVKKKTKAVIMDRYGVENIMQLPESVNKLKDTKQARYNNPTYNNVEKRKKTNLEVYGVEHPLQSTEIQQKSSLTRKTNYYDPAVLSKLNNKDWLEEQFKSGLSVGEIAKILDVSSSNLCKYFNNYGINVNVGRNTSSIEREVVNFISSLGITNIITNDRTILNKQEIDIYLPDYQLAIEVNGLYWHCESHGKSRLYHYNKSKECLQKGIQLLHILDVSWISKKEIWESIITSKLNLNSRLYARKCTVAELDTQTAKQFINENHLSGYIGGCKKLGLYYNSELVQVAVFGKARFNKKYDYELIRLASKLGINVVGGASKLLAQVKGSIVSYADLAYSNGKVYRNLGFEQLGQATVDFYYVKNNRLESRNKYQKHNLKKMLTTFDSTLSAWENMQLNGYDRFWGAGQLTFVKN